MDDGFDAMRRRNEQRQEQDQKYDKPQESRIGNLPFWKIVLLLVVSLAKDFWNAQFPRVELSNHSPMFLHYISKKYDKRGLIGFDESEIKEVPPPPPLWNASERRIWNQKYRSYALSPSEAVLRQPPKAYTESREVPVIIGGRRVSKLGVAVGVVLFGVIVFLVSLALRTLLG